MFINDIQNYSEESSKLRKLYSSRCPKCMGQGLIISENGHVNCDCIKRANIHARLICNGMPRKYLDKRLDDMKDELKDYDILKDFCDNIENNMCNGSNLFISGTNKIKIMELDAAIANGIAYKKNYDGYFYNVLFVTVEDLMQTVYTAKNNYELKQKLQKTVTSVDILVLNFLGEETETRSEHTSKYLNDLFTQRIFNEKVNIISSSLNVEEIANKYGAQFINILKHNFKFVKFGIANASINQCEKDDENGYY
jgi:DNA replication protein DnaC